MTIEHLIEKISEALVKKKLDYVVFLNTLKGDIDIYNQFSSEKENEEKPSEELSISKDNASKIHELKEIIDSELDITYKSIKEIEKKVVQILGGESEKGKKDTHVLNHLREKNYFD